jgi:DNA (cytosine-5)-methyltransferase 1
VKHGSLFAGIGGFDLGFERAGIETVWQVEIDRYCRQVLRKNFPRSKRYRDVRRVGKRNLPWVDVISGGFPCQDISQAGKRAGIEGSRSGLWREMARIIGELRPRFAVVENVAALLGRGMGRVLGDLAEIGYDAEWQCIRASDVGAPHRRERIWIVADAAGARRGGRTGQEQPVCGRASLSARPSGCGDVGDATIAGLPHGTIFAVGEPGEDAQLERPDWWTVEPDVGRVAHGIPARVDRLKGLGNAIVPQIAEWIGKRLMANA